MVENPETTLKHDLEPELLLQLWKLLSVGAAEGEEERRLVSAVSGPPPHHQSNVEFSPLTL